MIGLDEATHTDAKWIVTTCPLDDVRTASCKVTVDDASKVTLGFSGTYTTYALKDGSKHPQHEHVEDDVGPPAVHKQVGEELVEVEVVGQDEVQSQQAREVCSSHLPEHQCGDKHQHIDDKQVFGDGWYFWHSVFSLIDFILKSVAKLRKKSVK